MHCEMALEKCQMPSMQSSPNQQAHTSLVVMIYSSLSNHIAIMKRTDPSLEKGCILLLSFNYAEKVFLEDPIELK